MIVVTPAILEAVAGGPVSNDIDRPLAAKMTEQFPAYEITTSERAAHFLAQCSHESGGFKYLVELGGPTYFLKYDGRRDLGNRQAGDGYKFRGRGIIQITGRANYAVYGQRLGLDLLGDPDLAAEPENAVRIALEFWRAKGLNASADLDDLRSITRAINGGLNGYDSRAAALVRAKEALP